MRNRSNRRLAGAIAVAVLLALPGCGRWGANGGEAETNGSAAARPGSYRLGMDLRQTFDALSEQPASVAAIEVLEHNMDAWLARWRLIGGARERIDVDYFIFGQDVFGMALLGRLRERAEQGVRVRVQIDAQGRRMSPSPKDLDCVGFLAKTPNLTIRVHRPLGRRLLEAVAQFDPMLATASDHDKIIVVDGQRSLIGGRNIEAKYFVDPADLDTAFQDVDLLLDGPGTAAALTAVFESMYESEHTVVVDDGDGDTARCPAALQSAAAAMDAWLHDRPLRDAGEVPETAWAGELAKYPGLRGAALRANAAKRFTAETRVLDSMPRQDTASDAVTEGMNRMFAAVTRTVVMESPYLVLTRDAAAMLESASDRGVDLALLTNSPVSTDNTLSQWYFREQWPRLLAAVPRLRLYAAGTRHTVHSKFVVFDQQAVLLGSYNLDPFSRLINGEVMVAAWSRPLAKRLSRRALEMIAHGPPAAYQYAIARDADGQPLRTVSGEPKIAFGPEDHTDASRLPRPGLRFTLLRAVPWLAGLPQFF